MINLRHLPAQFSISSQVCYEKRYFIPTLLDFSLLARCNFLSISLLALGYFIPSSLHFSLLSRCNFLSFHYLPWAISYPPCGIFHCLPGMIFYHFISCPGAFHTLLIYFSLLTRCNFLLISILALGHFIPCMGSFHTHPVGFFITWQVRFIYPFHSLPWAISYLPAL